jgi:hypothetical protein
VAKLFRLSLATLTFLVFFLLDDPVNELFLSVGLGASRILTLAHPTIGLFAKGPIVERRFYAYGLRCWVDEARILG